MNPQHKFLHFSTGNNLLDSSLERYLVHGIMPGGFLSAVLANDLHLAVCRGDYWNARSFVAIVSAIINNMPRGSCGSWEDIQNWKSDNNAIRTAWVDERRKKFIVESLKGEHHEKYTEEPPF